MRSAFLRARVIYIFAHVLGNCCCGSRALRIVQLVHCCLVQVIHQFEHFPSTSSLQLMHQSAVLSLVSS